MQRGMGIAPQVRAFTRSDVVETRSIRSARSHTYTTFVTCGQPARVTSAKIPSPLFAISSSSCCSSDIVVRTSCPGGLISPCPTRWFLHRRSAVELITG